MCMCMCVKGTQVHAYIQVSTHRSLGELGADRAGQSELARSHDALGAFPRHFMSHRRCGGTPFDACIGGKPVCAYVCMYVCVCVVFMYEYMEQKERL